MNLAIITAHAGATCLTDAMRSWGRTVPVFLQDGKDGMLPAYQRGFETTADYDILAYIHDDTIVNDPEWTNRVLAEFADPTVGLVGLGGALGHGSPDLYKVPYDYHQLGRSDFLSNMRDAENHGRRFTGACDVAVLDGFALIVRRSVLEECGGWPIGTAIGYINYDYWLCCMVRRMDYRIRLVGVACDHLGGQTFVKLGKGDDPKHWEQYIQAHRYIYEHFTDVLPWRVK